MKADERMSRPVHTFDCQVRMFLASVCLTDDDLRDLGVFPRRRSACVSPHTVARSALHRLLGEPSELSRGVTDLLDVRHAATILEVRALEPERAAAEACARGRSASGERLAGWAWAFLTDPRPEVARAGRCLMGECYVRGMRLLSDDTAA